MNWSVALFTSREDPETLFRNIEAVAMATSPAASTLDVIVNGARPLALETAQRLGKFAPAAWPSTTVVRVWYLPRADKAYAWNEYVYSIWPGSDLAFFVDGYVKVNSDAFRQIAQGISAMPAALAATGVATMGPSANRLRGPPGTHGGIHGNLYALRRETVIRLRESGFRLPLGIYRTDPVMGAAIVFNFDPAQFAWDSNRIATIPAATWSYPTPKWWNPRDWRGYLRRRIRQAQGTLETHAVRARFGLERRPVGSLPATAKELVSAWVRDYPQAARRVLRRSPFALYAYRALLTGPSLAPLDARGELLSETANRGVGGVNPG